MNLEQINKTIDEKQEQCNKHIDEGRKLSTIIRANVLDKSCPHCEVKVGKYCVTIAGRTTEPHQARCALTPRYPSKEDIHESEKEYAKASALKKDLAELHTAKRRLVTAMSFRTDSEVTVYGKHDKGFVVLSSTNCLTMTPGLGISASDLHFYIANDLKVILVDEPKPQYNKNGFMYLPPWPNY